MSNDIVDNIDIASGREERVYIEPKIKKDWKDRFFKYLDGTDSNQVFETNDDEYDDIKITAQWDGHDRTVSLSRIDKISMIENIPDAYYDEDHAGDQSLIIGLMRETALSYADKMLLVFCNK